MRILNQPLVKSPTFNKFTDDNYISTVTKNKNKNHKPIEMESTAKELNYR